jgi:hypothetical protein
MWALYESGNDEEYPAMAKEARELIEKVEKYVRFGADEEGDEFTEFWIYADDVEILTVLLITQFARELSDIHSVLVDACLAFKYVGESKILDDNDNDYFSALKNKKISENETEKIK